MMKENKEMKKETKLNESTCFIFTISSELVCLLCVFVSL